MPPKIISGFVKEHTTTVLYIRVGHKHGVCARRYSGLDVLFSGLVTKFRVCYECSPGWLRIESGFVHGSCFRVVIYPGWQQCYSCVHELPPGLLGIPVLCSTTTLSYIRVWLKNVANESLLYVRVPNTVPHTGTVFVQSVPG